MNSIDPEKEKELLHWLDKNIGFENYKFAIDRTYKRLIKYIPKFSKKPKVITIGGTNGKGETSQFIAQALSFNQKSFSLFNSPHVFSIRERFSSHKGEVSYAQLESLFKSVQKELAGEVISFFEFLFIAFLKWSDKLGVEYLVLEVGLGGRLDATNALDADIALITSIGRDHQEFLGHRLQDILNEKLGISRRGKLLITNFQLKYLREHTKAASMKKGVPYIDLQDCKVSHPGDSFRKMNMDSAEMVIKQLELKFPERVDLKVRSWKINHGSSHFQFYGSHNLDGVRKLITHLCKSSQSFDKIIIAFSRRELSDIEHILRSLLAYASKKCKILLTDNKSHHKSISLDEITQTMPKGVLENIDYEDNWIDIFKEFSFEDNQSVLVLGSYYFIAPFYQELKSFRSRVQTKI